MTVNLNSIPTSNTIEFQVKFYAGTVVKATLAYGQASPLSIAFDHIGIGNSLPQSMYQQETPGTFTISPGNLAFVDRSVGSKLVLRYGAPGGKQQNIVFVPVA